MAKRFTHGSVSNAAAQLRAVSMLACAGDYLGNEEELQLKFKTSRATIRQAARIVEREGLLAVKRGHKGGYFSSRPSIKNVEEQISNYLELLDIKLADLTAVASALWAQAVGMAAVAPKKQNPTALLALRDRLEKIGGGAKFEDVLALEEESRTAIFDLIESQYIAFVFQLNASLARRALTLPPAGSADLLPAHEKFVLDWKRAKLLELEAVFLGDQELGRLAALRVRAIWKERLTIGQQ
jgi:GntR family transcriptional regulator, transcriptional repressor for pyruvate dehydrogenase complex